MEAVELPGPLAAFACRNNRLAQLGLAQDGFAAAVRASTPRTAPPRRRDPGHQHVGNSQTEMAYRQREPDSGRMPAGYDYAHA